MNAESLPSPGRRPSQGYHLQDVESTVRALSTDVASGSSRSFASTVLHMGDVDLTSASRPLERLNPGPMCPRAGQRPHVLSTVTAWRRPAPPAARQLVSRRRRVRFTLAATRPPRPRRNQPSQPSGSRTR